MAQDISNNAGGGTGAQKIGGITISTSGKAAISKFYSDMQSSSPGHDGDFVGTTGNQIIALSGKYDARFDDVGYYA